MPSIRGAFTDIRQLADDRGEGEMLKNGIPAKDVVKGFPEPVPGDRFAMHIPIEVQPARAASAYEVDYLFPSARMTAAVVAGMEIPIKIIPTTRSGSPCSGTSRRRRSPPRAATWPRSRTPWATL